MKNLPKREWLGREPFWSGPSEEVDFEDLGGRAPDVFNNWNQGMGSDERGGRLTPALVNSFFANATTGSTMLDLGCVPGNIPAHSIGDDSVWVTSSTGESEIRLLWVSGNPYNTIPVLAHLGPIPDSTVQERIPVYLDSVMGYWPITGDIATYHEVNGRPPFMLATTRWHRDCLMPVWNALDKDTNLSFKGHILSLPPPGSEAPITDAAIKTDEAGYLTFTASVMSLVKQGEPDSAEANGDCEVWCCVSSVTDKVMENMPSMDGADSTDFALFPIWSGGMQVCSQIPVPKGAYISMYAKLAKDGVPPAYAAIAFRLLPVMSHEAWRTDYEYN